jgi:hypothetical protein
MDWLVRFLWGIVFIFIGMILAKPVQQFIDFWFKSLPTKNTTINTNPNKE